METVMTVMVVMVVVVIVVVGRDAGMLCWKGGPW